jgi:Cu2+-exporting ATPase
MRVDLENTHAAAGSEALNAEVWDDPQEWTAFSRRSASYADCWESSVVFEGMHCAACALNIEDALKNIPGVMQVDVSAGSHRGRIVWSQTLVKPSRWIAAAKMAGYTASPANDLFDKDRRTAESRLAVWRLGVAGLCMMQVMMYAWPAYVADPGDLAPDMAQLLRWASWVLSLPVLLFSCAPFFQSAWLDLRQRRVSMDLPVALGMLITFVVSSSATFDPNGWAGNEVYFDSFTMFVFFLLAGRWLELRLRDRTAGALEALLNRLPASVQRRLPDGSFEKVAVRRLRVGDVLRVLPAEAFPADGLVEQGSTLADESLLTGESRPLRRQVGDAVIAGSFNLLSDVLISVQRLGKDTRFSQIVDLMESASTTRPHTAQLAERLARPFLIAVLLAATGVGVWGWSQNSAHALMVAVSVLIVTCPCALSLATPAGMLASAGALARRGVMVRRLQALENLAVIDTVVFDKTGTLTRDALTLLQIQVRAGVSPDQALAMAAALGQYSLHPVSRALVSQLGKATKSIILPLWHATEVQETPGQGVEGRLTCSDGAAVPRVRLGSARFCKVEAVRGPYLHTCLADDQGWLATFEFEEDLRPDAIATVAELKAAGLDIHLLSGDDGPAVQAVASAVGIQKALGACSPQEKLDYLHRLQEQGRFVAMVGDGLNDGPVLAGAHVSFAFGSAAPLARAHADIVVLGDQLLPVLQALRQAKQTRHIVKQNLWWAALYNLTCVPLAVMGWLPAWLAGLGMGLSSLFVVVNALRLSQLPPVPEV